MSRAEKNGSCRSHGIPGFPSHIFLLFSPAISVPHGMLSFPLEAPDGTGAGVVGELGNLAKSAMFLNDSQFSENKKHIASFKGSGRTNNY